MSTVLTEAATYAASVTVPADGDARTAASVVPAFQVLADRTKYLKTLTETTGIQKIKTVADNAALKALTGMATGDVVKQTDIRVIYVYDSGSATAEHNGIIVEPTTGGGRWFADFSVLTTEDANGDARLVHNPPNAIVDEDYQETASGSTAAFVNGSDTPFGPTITMTLKVGDIVHLDGFTMFDPNSYALGRYAVAIQETHSAATTVLTNSIREVTPRTNAPTMCLSPMARFVAGAAASHAFRMLTRITSGVDPTPFVFSPWQLRATVIRP